MFTTQPLETSDLVMKREAIEKEKKWQHWWIMMDMTRAINIGITFSVCSNMRINKSFVHYLWWLLSLANQIRSWWFIIVSTHAAVAVAVVVTGLGVEGRSKRNEVHLSLFSLSKLNMLQMNHRSSDRITNNWEWKWRLVYFDWAKKKGRLVCLYFRSWKKRILRHSSCCGSAFKTIDRWTVRFSRRWIFLNDRVSEKHSIDMGTLTYAPTVGVEMDRIKPL